MGGEDSLSELQTAQGDRIYLGAVHHEPNETAYPMNRWPESGSRICIEVTEFGVGPVPDPSTTPDTAPDPTSPDPTSPDPTTGPPTSPDPTSPDPTTGPPTSPDPTTGPPPVSPDPTSPDPTSPDPTSPDPTTGPPSVSPDTHPEPIDQNDLWGRNCQTRDGTIARAYYDNKNRTTPGFQDSHFTGSGNTNNPKIQSITRDNKGNPIRDGATYSVYLYSIDTGGANAAG